MIIYCSLSGSGGSQRLSTCSSSFTLSSLRGGRAGPLRSERVAGWGGEGRRVRLMQLDGNASQILFDFCPFSFLPECSYMVLILTRVALVSLSVSQNAPCCKKALISIKLSSFFWFEFPQDPCPKTLHPTFFFFLTVRSRISFIISLIGSVVNPVKSCTTSGQSFLQQEFTAWCLMVFTAFAIKTASSTV